MSGPKHTFSNYLMDPIPRELWRKASAIEDMKLGLCDSCGFYHVDPYPPLDYLADFYSRYEMPTSQANLSETARVLARNLDPNATVIDIGCGDGAFLKEMHGLGFVSLVGFDQSPGLDRAKSLGFGNFYKSSVWDFLAESEVSGGAAADALVMVNVLEHVVEPLDLLAKIYKIMPKGGLLCVTVPNDFSPLQQAFLKVKGHRPWFVCLPDHLNYFNFVTLAATFEKAGFEVIDQTTSYPMELFLLQDLDYIANPDLGPVAHKRRLVFEEQVKAAGMTDILDHFYETLAAGGYGRDITMVCRKS